MQRATRRYVLRSSTADGLPLWFHRGGPTIDRAAALEYSSRREAESARDHFAFIFDLDVETVAVGGADRQK